MPATRERKCRVCRKKYRPARNGQFVCGYKCAAQLAQMASAKKNRQAERANHKAAKERLKTKPQLKAEAQKDLNAYIRERDRFQPCISCGQPAISTMNYWDAGHYRSVGAAPHIRFYTLNIHKQCKRCNRDLDGNIVEYRKGLLDRLGVDQVERIEAMQHDHKPDREWLIRLGKLARKKTRIYRKLRLNNLQSGAGM